MGQRSSRCKEAKKDLGRVHFHDGTPSHSFTCLVKAHPHPLGVVEETVGGEKETTRKEDNSKKKKRFRLWRWRSFCWRAGRKYSRKSSLVQSDVEAQGPGASAAHPGIIPDVQSFLQQVICSVENHNHQEPSTSDPEILLAAEEHLAVHSDVLQSLACSDNVAQTPVDTELNWCANIAQTLVHATSDWSIDVSQTPVRTASDCSIDVSQTPVRTTSDWSTDVSQTPVCTTSDWSTDVSQTPECTTSDWSTDVSQTPVHGTPSDWSIDVSQTPLRTASDWSIDFSQTPLRTASDWSIDVSQTPLRTASDWSIDVFQTPVRTASDWSIDFSQTPVHTASDCSIDVFQTPVRTASDCSIDVFQTPVRTASDCSIDVFQTPVRTASDWSIDFSQTPVHTASDWRIDVFQTPVRTASDWSIDFSQTPVRGTPSDRSTDVIQSLVHTTFDWNANVTQTPVCTTSDWYIDVGQTTVSPTEISVSPLTRQLENNKNETVVINSCYYVISDMLGEGTFGTVYDGSRLLDGFKVAVKIVRKTEDFEYISIPNHPRPLPLEVALLTLANRGPRVPEIIQLLDWEDQHDYYIMVLEHPSPCEDLFGLTERYGGSIDEGLARIVMQQAAQAAYMCCHRGVLHRDIKLENLLINKETHEVKLIDFGCGDLLKKSAYKIFLGTDEYCPPEYEEKGEYNGKPATVWSLGVLLFALVNGDYPSTDDLHMINANNYSKAGLSEECCRLISSCLQREPEQRLRLSEILLHDWFKVTDVDNLKTV